MTFLPDPIWPVLVLAAISAADGALCLKPARFIAECFTDVGFPRRYWRLTPPIKFAAALGLVGGIWLPGLGILTTGSLVLYFLVAMVMHIRARDFRRNLFLNASGMLGICTATLVACFCCDTDRADRVASLGSTGDVGHARRQPGVISAALSAHSSG